MNSSGRQPTHEKYSVLAVLCLIMSILVPSSVFLSLLPHDVVLSEEAYDGIEKNV